MKLLALILAYVISHFIKNPETYRNFSWFKSWSKWFEKTFSKAVPEISVIFIIGIPVFVIYLISNNMFAYGASALLFAIVVLSYCIGPRSLEDDVASGEIKKRLNLRKNAKISLLIKTMTQVSLYRWFGILFWYLLLGIIGALMYRFSERLLSFLGKNSKLEAATSKLMKILNYPVAWMMVMSLAIASDFERIYKKCKPHLNLKYMKEMDDSFLYEAADFAVENCEVEAGNKKKIEEVTLSVLNRMLIVWLVFVAILVIFGV